MTCVRSIRGRNRRLALPSPGACAALAATPLGPGSPAAAGLSAGVRRACDRSTATRRTRVMFPQRVGVGAGWEGRRSTGVPGPFGVRLPSRARRRRQAERPIREEFPHQRHRYVEHGRIRPRAPFGLAVVRVAVEDRRHRVARERLLEAAAAEERIDLERLALDRLLDRRVVQDRDEPIGAQPRQRRLELQRFVQASWTNFLMIGSPHGPSARRPKPPAKPLTPAKPMP